MSLVLQGKVQKKNKMSIQNVVFSLENVNDLTTDNTDHSMSANYSFLHEASLHANPEVLDLTHNHHDPFKLHFDDQEWHKFMSSLKPLGLAILLNTCNIDTQVRNLNMFRFKKNNIFPI